MTERFDVAVVGGGVTGLVAALRLSGTCRVVVLEAGERLGGKLLTGRLGGHVLDLGPDAFLTRRRSAEELCRELGLAGELVAPSGVGAAVFARGRLRPFPRGVVLGVPTDLSALARSGIVGPAAVLRAAADLVLPGLSAPASLLEAAEGGGPDPTIAEVVGRRLGDRVLAALVDPLLGGINAGDVRSLSFAASAPSLATKAAGRRSLLRALRTSERPEEADRAGGAHPLFLGLLCGLGGLVEALARACERSGVDLRCSTPVSRLVPETNGRWRVESGSGPLEVEAVVLATPSFAAAPLLETAAPGLASELASIAYASVATVTLAWPVEAVPPGVGAALARLAPPRRLIPEATSPTRDRLLPGNGFLVPRDQSRLVTSATFTSTKWPHSVPEGLVAVRASVGRSGDDRHSGLDEAVLVERVRSDLAGLLGIEAPPVEAVVQRWPSSFPQYVSGHRALVGRLRDQSRGLPLLALAGAAYDGIGIPSCVESGERAAADLAGGLGR